MKHDHRSLILVACALLGAPIALTACADSTTLEANDAGPTSQPAYTRTIVKRAADGTTTVTLEPIVDEQAGARDAPFADASPIPDPGCAAADLRLFTAPNMKGNELCFFGHGDLYLDAYRYQVCAPLFPCFYVSWGASVRSFIVGVQAVDVGSYPWEHYASYQQRYSVSEVVKNAWYMFVEDYS